MKKPTNIFLKVSVVVFILLFGLVALVTFMKPKTYAGTARVRLKSVPAQPALAAALSAQTNAVRSEAVLDPVIENMHLNALWGKKIRIDDQLKTWESVTLLRQKMQITPMRGTKEIEIKVEDDDSAEAANIANRVAASLCGNDVKHTLEISQQAEPDSTPVSPDIPVYLALGAAGSAVIALLVGRTAAGLSQALEKGAQAMEAKQT